MKSQTRGKSSEIESLSCLSVDEQEKILKSFSRDEAEALIWDWNAWARPDQLAPPGDDWYIWLLMTGRGWGKTRTGAEWVVQQAKKKNTRIALVGRTPSDVRDVMIEGESGIMNISPPWFKPLYEPSKKRLTWPNGSLGSIYSSETPESLRGPQHHKAWGDELASWKTSRAYDNLMFGLRLGDKTQAVFTTTPKPINTVKEIVRASHSNDSGIKITRGKTYDNVSNLAPIFFKSVIKKYEGTTLGRQELDGVLFDDLPGALWNRSMIDPLRVDSFQDFKRIVVAIDPNVSSSREADEAGIVVVGLGRNEHGYVLQDGSGHYSPLEWAERAVALCHSYGADRIVAEVNNGGELVEITLRTFNRNIPYKSVHASRGKTARAEPIAALYEQGKVHHIGTNFEDLEDELCTYIGGESKNSPNRMDALVWGLTWLMISTDCAADYSYQGFSERRFSSYAGAF